MAMDPSVPMTHEFGVLLSQINRLATTKARLAVELCNYEWAGSAEHERARERVLAQLKVCSATLGVLWPGSSLEFGNDPRGYVVRVILPNGRNEAWAGGVGVA